MKQIIYKYQLYKDDSGYTFCISTIDKNFLPPNFILIWEIEAFSYIEAMKEYYKYMNWGEYKEV